MFWKRKSWTDRLMARVDREIITINWGRGGPESRPYRWQALWKLKRRLETRKVRLSATEHS